MTDWKEKFLNKIVCGDCLELMPEIPDKSIDMTLTSSPYDNLRKYNGYVFNFENIAQQLFRITKQGGIVVWIVGDATINGSETGASFKQALYFKEIGFNLHDTMIWNKGTNRYPETNRYFPCYEFMFILSKGKPNSSNLIKDRINKYFGYKIARKSANRDINGKMKENSAYKNDKNRISLKFGVRFNIWNIQTSTSNGDKCALEHPASFSETLANDHIISWSNENSLILDPMCGSGTTCKIAKKLNRQFIGIDFSEKYCEIARKRVDAVHPSLFDKYEI